MTSLQSQDQWYCSCPFCPRPDNASTHFDSTTE